MRDEELGRGTGRQGPWEDDDEDARAARQRGDPNALDVEGDPRGGVQSDEYRHADPRELVEEGDTAMMGPGGTPQEESSVEKRREASREQRERAMAPHPPEED
jgi:hypothetical protein